MTSGDAYEGWSTVFFQCLDSKGDPKMTMVFQLVSPKSPKIVQNDQKNTIFNLRQVYTPSKGPERGQSAGFTPSGSPKGCKNRILVTIRPFHKNIH